MSILSEHAADSLTLDRMIFHVVDPKSGDPVYLAEVSAPECHAFFVERVKETLKGAAYTFLPGAGMPALLLRAIPREGRDEFVKVSRDLAQRFKEKVKQDKRMAAGVLMLLVLSTAEKDGVVAVIKYEHQDVVAYTYKKDEHGDPIKDSEGNPVPDLETLVQTFTQDRKSMQKSAVVRFSVDDVTTADPMVVVVDHSSGRYRDATQHFANFLDIRRALEPDELRQRLEDATVEAIRAHKSEVPNEVARSPKRFVRSAMARLEGFDFQKPEEFLGAVLQGMKPDAPILRTFQAKLAVRKIGTEAFQFVGNVPVPEFRKLVTREGVTVFYSKDHEDGNKIRINDNPAGGVIITIQSTGLEQNDDVAKLPRMPA